MFVKCVECDHILEDEEYLYKGKSYCDDCYRAVKKMKKLAPYLQKHSKNDENTRYSQVKLIF